MKHMVLIIGKSVILGTVLWAFVCLFSWRMSEKKRVIEYRFTADALPDNDSALTAWFLNQPNAVDAVVVRDGKITVVRFVSSSTDAGFGPQPPWGTMGYDIPNTALGIRAVNESKSGYPFFDVYSEIWRSVVFLLCFGAGFGLTIFMDWRGTQPANPPNIA